jgi:hypothetical protein
MKWGGGSSLLALSVLQCSGVQSQSALCMAAPLTGRHHPSGRPTLSLLAPSTDARGRRQGHTTTASKEEEG